MHPECPYVYPLELLSRKWSYLVLRALQTPRSFSKVKAELHYITNRMLSQELKLLQSEGVLMCNEGTYQLTPAGKALLPAIEPLVAWSTKYKGSKQCCPERTCSSCLEYPAVVDAKRFVTVRE